MIQLFSPTPHPPIHELGRKELKLAGLRIDPETNGRSRMTGYSVGMSIVPAGTVVPLDSSAAANLPITGYTAGHNIHDVSWAPDSKHLVFATMSAGGDGDPARGPLQLWAADTSTGKSWPLIGSRRLNSIFHDYSWLDDQHIIAAVIPEGRGDPPGRPKVSRPSLASCVLKHMSPYLRNNGNWHCRVHLECGCHADPTISLQVPAGPKIQENMAGSKSQVRTFPDLLQDPHDEETFEYYCTSEVIVPRNAPPPASGRFECCAAAAACFPLNPKVFETVAAGSSQRDLGRGIATVVPAKDIYSYLGVSRCPIHNAVVHNKALFICCSMW